VSDDPEDLDGLLELLGEDGPGQPDPISHPTSGILSAYASKKLPPDQELEVQEHLVSCRRCRDLILDFASFMETPLEEGRERSSDVPTPVKLREELIPSVTMISRTKREPLWRTLLPIAASIGIVIMAGALIGISRSNGKLRTQITQLQAPRVGIGSVRLEATRSAAVSIPSNKMTDLEISTSHPEDFPRYEIELAEEDGRVFWSRPAEKVEGVFHLVIMPGFPKPGLYRIRLFGVQGPKRERLESYSVRVKP
jgi:hypothetical protein